MFHNPQGYNASGRLEVMANQLGRSEPWLWRKNGVPPKPKSIGPTMRMGKLVVGAFCKQCGSRLYPHICW